MAFGYLSSFLYEKLGFDDIVLEVNQPKNILASSPDIIGISSFTETFEDVIQLSRYFKRVAPDIPLVVGGEHISALPQSLPPTVDYGVLGEGEETLTELLALMMKRDVTPDNLLKIPGLIFWNQGKQWMSPPREWISDLDVIPMPHRQLLSNADPRWQQAIFTARGCPYKCTFCASTKFWQKTRYHSVERVIQEIEYIMKHYPQQTLIPINDDLFPLNKRRMKDIVDAIRAKNIHQKVGFVLNARASVFDEEIARLMAGMNGIVVGFGFESASDKILTSIKGKTSASENLRALELCEKYGFAVVGNFMVGGPDENKEDMAKTYWFIEQNKHRIWHPSVALATPFPGTEFWVNAKERGLVSDDFPHWNVLDLGYRADESVYMGQDVPQEEFTPIYEQFREFQAHPVTSKEEYVEIVARRQYYDFLYQKVGQLPAQRVLNLSFEAVDLSPYFQGETQALSPEQGHLSLTEAEGPFDLIVLNHVLEKVKDPVTLIQEASALLTEQGQMVCLCYNALHLSFVIQLLKGQWDPGYFSVNHTHALRFFTEQTLKTLLSRSGLQLESIEPMYFPRSDFGALLEKLRTALQPVGEAIPSEETMKTFSFLATLSQKVASSKVCRNKSPLAVDLPILPHS